MVVVVVEVVVVVVVVVVVEVAVVIVVVVVVVVIVVVDVDVVEDFKVEMGNKALESEINFSLPFITFSILSSTTDELSLGIDGSLFALGNDKVVTFVRDDASFAILSPHCSLNLLLISITCSCKDIDSECSM